QLCEKLEAAGELELVEKLYSQLLEAQEDILGDDDPELAPTLIKLTSLRERLEKFEEAIPAYERVLEIYATSKPEPEQIAAAQAGLAQIYFTAENLEKAEEYSRAALELRKAHLASDDINLGTNYELLARIYRAHYNALAGEYYSRALTVWEEILGSDHPDVAERLNNLVVLYRLYGRFADAEPLYQRMLDIHDNSEQPLDLVSDLTNLAVLYQAQAKFEDAEPLLVRALQLLQDSYGQEAEQAWVLNHMGDLLDYQGRFENAESILMRSLGIWESLLGQDHSDLTVVLDALARHHRMNQKFEAGEEFARRSLTIKERTLGEKHPESISSLATLAEILRLSGREEEARQTHFQVIIKRQENLVAAQSD
ncbi:unnamed protein product, partial [Phaeothamnion confervicola]